MARITLQQISSKQAQFNVMSGLHIPKNQEYLANFLSAEEMTKIKAIYDGDSIHLWGVKYSRSKAWANMIDDITLVLFRKSDSIAEARHLVIFDTLTVDIVLLPSVSCFDCRKSGSLTKPEFWID